MTPYPAAVRRFLALLRLDLRLQRRYGLVRSAVVIAVLWITLLRLLPPGARSVAAPLVVFGDLAVVGFFFVGALLLFEKSEGTPAAVAVAPAGPGAVIAARVAALTLLAAALTAAVVGLGYGRGAAPLPLAVGVVLCSVTAVLAGVAVAAPFTSVSRYLLPAVLPLVVLGLPLLDVVGWLPAGVLVGLPTGGSWMAVDAAFGAPADGWLAAGLALNVAWVVAAAALAWRQHIRHVMRAPA